MGVGCGVCVATSAIAVDSAIDSTVDSGVDDAGGATVGNGVGIVGLSSKAATWVVGEAATVGVLGCSEEQAASKSSKTTGINLGLFTGTIIAARTQDHVRELTFDS